MSETRLRYLAGELATLKELAELLETNISKLWAWRQGADLLTPEERDTLETYLVGKLAKYEFLITRGCAGRAMA